MRMILAAAVGLVLHFGIPAGARADDKPLDRAELDKRAAKVAFDAAFAGTAIFNSGGHGECYRLYQGTLMALLPMLDHQPKLATLVKDRLDKAKGMRAADGATVLREALDAVMGQGKPATPLWDRLGGEKTVRTLVREAGTAAAADPKLNFTRDGKYKLDEKGVARMEQLLVEFVSESGGGPLKYTGRNLAAVHKGMKITDDEFAVLMRHLVATLKKHKVGQAEIDELVAGVEATRKDIVEVLKKPLWDRLGGEKGVRAVVREFITSVAKDPKVNVDRSGNYPLTKERAERIEQLAVELISSVTGGPLKYTGRDMKAAHQGMMITGAEFDAAAGHLVAALKKFEVPQAEIDELIAIIATTKKDIVEKK
jgi:hemoglobin